MTHNAFWAGAGLAATLLAGCGEEPPPAPTQAPTAAYPAPNRPATENRAMTQQERFLARIQQATAGNNVIRDARMNRDDELGVVLDSRVQPEEVRPLMTTLLKGMREEFPGRPLTVIAYTPNGKPMATMRYDPAAPADANVTYQPNF